MDIDPDIHIQSGELIDINAMTSAESDELITRVASRDLSQIDYSNEHEAFAASRSSDYIYAGDDGPFNALDSHAESVEGDIKLPLVVTGPVGCGKSALLANWVKQRNSSKHHDEFLFQHFVGCSPRSRQLSHLLYRLESALKEHFQLREMAVPTSEERLRWSLNRFLAAAAKKRLPARIVIVVDAVNQLRGESSVADTLHWLPTELPRGVRIIVSTVEQEQNEEARVHRTYTELRRRKCPTFHLQPLSVERRHQIIASFLDGNCHALQSLGQAQQFKLVTAKASSQPLFLRTILYALRLASEMTGRLSDEQIDTYLTADTSLQLIALVLESSCNYMHAAATTVRGSNTNSPANSKKTLEQILTALYASRHGLSEQELWGIVEVATNKPLSLEERKCIRRILCDYTFSVTGLRSFSHEDYAMVVYREYICSPELHVRAHQMMARYFNKLPVCDRKLDALPYHLEVGGSWSKLRSILVDIQMFGLWWTSVHKAEFLNLWASLTSSLNVGTPIQRLVTGEFDDTMRCAQSPRPYLDIVEEYTRSVDEFKFVNAPSDDELANVTLRVAEFMLEFATLSLEEAADVPQFLHPYIPNDDLASLGVPFLSRDKDGNSVINTPCVESLNETPWYGSKSNSYTGASTKAKEAMPFCSTYFYHRWMWVQFPWVSLANCGERFLKGLANRPHKEVDEANRQPSLLGQIQGGAISAQTTNACASEAQRLPRIRPSATFEIVNPDTNTLKTTTVAAKSKGVRRPSRGVESDRKAPAKSGFTDHFAVQMKQLRAAISSYRSELDQLKQERIHLARMHCRAQDEISELHKMHLSTSDLELKLNKLGKRLVQTVRGHKMAKLLYKNYESVKLMCERHPAHSQALIDELEDKLIQDTRFIQEVEQRIRETTFDSYNFATNSKILQHAAQEMTLLQNDMIIQRVRQRQHLQSTTTDEEAKKKDATELPHIDVRGHKGVNARDSEAGCTSKLPLALSSHDVSLSNIIVQWQDHTSHIHKHTFITSVRDFYAKYYTAQSLQKQMRALHNTAEKRQRKLKQNLSLVELDLEQMRYESQSVLGSNSREVRELKAQVNVQSDRRKHACEVANGAKLLCQAAFGGIKHVCTMLGIPPPDQDTPVNEIIHQVEGVLEALTEERDKNAQKLGESLRSKLDSSPDRSRALRAPEVDAALEHFDLPKARIAHRLINKVSNENRSAQRPISSLAS